MVDLQGDGTVARVFLDRPQKANALTSAMLRELLARCEELQQDGALRAVVLGGRGKTFCGGADLAELARLNAETARAFISLIHQACAALRRLPVPVVAQLHGAVIGAGLELAAACDLRVAAPGTTFSMPEVRIGIPSVVEAALLPRLVGAGRAAWLVLTGAPIDAERALAWGLIEKIGAEPEVEEVLRHLLAGDRDALRVQKQLLQLWDDVPLAMSVAASIERFAGMPKHQE